MMQRPLMQRPLVSTVLLAGGQGTRMGGNKTLRELRGRPLIDWVHAAVSPQSAELLISANGNPSAYAHLGCAVIADRLPGFAGPLAGLQAAMQCARHDWVASVPCDTPFLPDDLIARLFDAVGANDAAVALVEGRRQPTIALYHRRVLPRLDAYLESGERRMGGWLRTLHAGEAVFEDAVAFININTPQDLETCNAHE